MRDDRRAARARRYARRRHAAPDAATLRLHQLVDAHYVEAAVARAGETLSAERPFPFRLDTGAWLHL